eukprot:4324013-Amphidinium_carterae.1
MQTRARSIERYQLQDTSYVRGLLRDGQKSCWLRCLPASGFLQQAAVDRSIDWHFSQPLAALRTSCNLKATCVVVNETCKSTSIRST